jgi:uncharacterized protein GlcG (DUF336 family)
MHAIYRAALIAGVCAFSAPVNAELLTHKDLTAMMGITIAQTALATCTANGYRVSVAVLGRNGEIGPHTLENSMRKAYTARTFRVPSGEIVQRVKENPQYFGIHLSNVIAAQGGLPINVGDDTIGSVGVSGAPGGEKDEACAKAGIEKVAAELK